MKFFVVSGRIQAGRFAVALTFVRVYFGFGVAMVLP